MILALLNNRLLLNHYKISLNHCRYLLSTTLSEWNSQKAWHNFKCKIGIYNHPKWEMKTSSAYLYAAATDKLPTQHYFDVLKLPNSYLSWFALTSLHLWLIMLRTVVEDREGIYLRNQIAFRFWEDAFERIKRLGMFTNRELQDMIKDLSGYFNAVVVGYDEGILSNNKILVAALWRNLYFYNQDPDPEVLELLINYIKCQLDHLFSMDSKFILTNGNLHWKPFTPLL